MIEHILNRQTKTYNLLRDNVQGRDDVSPHKMRIQVNPLLIWLGDLVVIDVLHPKKKHRESANLRRGWVCSTAQNISRLVEHE